MYASRFVVFLSNTLHTRRLPPAIFIVIGRDSSRLVIYFFSVYALANHFYVLFHFTMLLFDLITCLPVQRYLM